MTRTTTPLALLPALPACATRSADEERARANLRLAAALGRAGLEPTLFVLDEPCLGLHPLDVRRLLGAFDRLVEHGHTVITVEHHVEVIAAAAHVVELGPGPGDAGGRVVFAGPPRELAHADTSTGRLLARHATR